MAVKTVSLCLMICLKVSCSVNTFKKEYKDELFVEYAESRMTAGVAMKMSALKLPVTKDIVDTAMNCVNQQDKAEILFAKHWCIRCWRASTKIQ